MISTPRGQYARPFEDALEFHSHYHVFTPFYRQRNTSRKFKQFTEGPTLACVRKGSSYLGLTLEPALYSLGKAASLLAVRPVRLLLCAK